MLNPRTAVIINSRISCQLSQDPFAGLLSWMLPELSTTNTMSLFLLHSAHEIFITRSVIIVENCSQGHCTFRFRLSWHCKVGNVVCSFASYANHWQSGIWTLPSAYRFHHWDSTSSCFTSETLLTSIWTELLITTRCGIITRAIAFYCPGLEEMDQKWQNSAEMPGRLCRWKQWQHSKLLALVFIRSVCI